MATSPFTAPVDTKQSASGIAISRVFDNHNMMLWASAGSSRNILTFASAPKGSYSFKVQRSSVAVCPGTGPALVLLPALRTALVIYVNPSQQVVVARATASAATPPVWTLKDDGVVLPGSKAKGSPSACLQQQNGMLVVTVVWEDQLQGELVYAQVSPDNINGSLGFAKVPDSVLGTPTLAKWGAASFLCYTNTGDQVCLSVDPQGGVDFNAATAAYLNGIHSSYGATFVPLSRNQGYVIWTTGQRVQYQQVGINSQGVWVPNTEPECSGSLAMAATAAPTAQLVPVLQADGTTADGILVTAPCGTNGDVLVGGFMVDRSPIPIAS